MDSLAERREQMLGRFADLALELAEQLHADAMAAETPAERAELARSFHTLGRTLRQTFALNARLVREAAEAAREAETRADGQLRRRALRRQRVVADAVSRIVWTEHEDFDEDDAAPWFDEILERAEAESLAPDFLDTPIPILVARICQAMGLPVPQAEPDHAAAEPPAADVPVQNSG